jgi:hypothetical protein
MKSIIIAAAAALAVTAWIPTEASAQADIRIGPGGIRIDTDRDRRDRWGRRDRWDDRDRCRTVIERERRGGRTIETRRRICR